MTFHGPLVRYIQLLVAHAPGMPGMFSPPLRKPLVSDPDMHYGACVTSAAGKRSRHSRRMRNPQFYVSGTRPMTPSPLKPKFNLQVPIIHTFQYITVVQLRKYKLRTVLSIWRTPPPVSDFFGRLFGSVTSYSHMGLAFCKFEMFTMVRCHLSAAFVTLFLQLSSRLFEWRVRYWPFRNVNRKRY